MTPADDRMKILIDQVSIETVKGGNAHVHLDSHAEEMKPLVWIVATARVNGTQVKIPVELVLDIPKARAIAQRLVECAYVAERAAMKGEP